jgi:anaerobic dimethyl sulfoxide reductase subunit B (iron-sulfur subunit)
LFRWESEIGGKIQARQRWFAAAGTKTMGRLGFYFDMRYCVSCKACQMACKDRNNLWEGQYFRRVLDFDSGEGAHTNGSPRLRNYSGACNHCAKPACLSVCPVGAIRIEDDGVVTINRETCIGCGKCVKSCPYKAVMIKEPRTPAAKCDACGELRRRGKNPACVDACIARCLHFGALEDLEKKYGPGLVREIPALPDPAITEPSLLIRAAREND